MLNSVDQSLGSAPSAGSQVNQTVTVGKHPSHSSPRTFREIFNEFTAPFTLSLVLENKGNVARDHLASERTYLAYIRTSLACASAGVALVQLFTLSSSTNTNIYNQRERFARPLGAIVVLLGFLIIAFYNTFSSVVGLVRYFMTQAALVRGFFPVARNSIATIAFSLGAVVVIVFGVLVAETRN
ncbi:uncharacterized protein EDB93DRAFT_1228555 [Suillus bovinus]|uniref:uncharacterized protein n=1 Tax=Suillus bovinus TaxID=48563 RepID=UPI001B860365|nr:uncharacterized protein EDB93DRAFT_1228555 [Suillus bovinus]KAG2144193.1 hypothetical protein EDB93DRAFT_1228555 [Suillus bovinus]